MRMDILGSSLLLAIVSLALLAWKWRIDQRIAVISAIVLGGITAGLINWLDIGAGGLTLVALVPMELAFILIIAFLLIYGKVLQRPRNEHRWKQKKQSSP